MALSACGLGREARLAYQWLAVEQRADGSWSRTYVDGRSADHAAESHHAAYVPVGVWHEFLVTGDIGFAMRMWPAVWKATQWVLALQTPRGEVAWERDAAGQPGEFALLSGCASILQGLRCATALAVRRGPSAGMGTGRRAAGPRPGLPSRGVRGQERVRDGLVLPGPRRRAAGQCRCGAAHGGLGRVRRPWPWRALRQRPAMGDGGRDMRTGHVTGRVRPGGVRRRHAGSSRPWRGCGTRMAPTGRAGST